MNKLNINQIIKDNEDKIRLFLSENLSIKNGPSEKKLLCNCPNCNGPFKVTMNLDWGNCYCHKCSSSWTFYSFFKDLNLSNEFIELIKELTNLTNYDIYSKLINSVVHTNIPKEIKTSGFHKFIKDYGLFPIKKMKIAYNYALQRTKNNKEEVSKYYADEKYIYIPIIIEGEIKSFLCRSYLNINGSQRYKNISSQVSKEYDLINIKHLMGFQDEVFSNINNNNIYIAEGYFDSYSINASFKDYVSICLFGKSMVKSIFDDIKSKISPLKNIIIVLDSAKKDKDITENIIKLGKLFSSNYPNLYVSQLNNGDPNEIYLTSGSKILKQSIEDNKINFLQYMLYNYKERKKTNLDEEIAKYCQ